MVIPSWTMSGIVPPIRPGMSGASPDRSPYKSALTDFIDQFAINQARLNILAGLIKYRQALHEIGLTEGFQWLDGSFLEDVEGAENRTPRDIDVVTFYRRPKSLNESELAVKLTHLLNTEHSKNRYHVDGYGFELGSAVEPYKIRMLTYWYSMWSHRRDGLWKGFVQIDLAPIEDDDAEIIIVDKLAKGF